MKKLGSVCLVSVAFLTLALLASTFASGSDIVVSGRVRHQGVVQEGPSTFSTYEITTERYIVVARATVDVGTVVPLDHAVVTRLCEDEDGCAVVLQMLDEFVSQPGNVASVTAHLFLSKTLDSDWWQLSSGVLGDDDNGSASQWDFKDCRFTDAEDFDSNNVSLDTELGFGLLNLDAGAHPDTVTCRVMLSD